MEEDNVEMADDDKQHASGIETLREKLRARSKQLKEAQKKK
jgi:hypothetical protein